MAEAEKASQILNRINQTNNLVQQTAQKTGQTVAAAYNNAGKSIEVMNIQLARLKTQISVSSDPKRVAELSAQYKALATQIKNATDQAFKLPKALNETKQSTQSLTQQFGGLYNSIRLVITAGIIKEIAALAINMSELSGRVEGVERAFQHAFPNAEVLLSGLVEATHGTVSEFELMANALKANNLGIPIQQLATFFEFATIRAQQTGEEVNVLVDNIVNGLGRKSTRVIDNLGISATRIKEEFHGVSLEQLSVAEVAEGVSNIIKQETEKMGGYIETSQTQVKRLGVAWQELKQQLSNLNLGDFIKFITGADVGEFTLTGHILGLVEALRDAAEMIRNQIAPEEFYAEKQAKQIALISEREFAQRVLNGTMEQNVKAIEDEIAAITSGLGVFAKERGFAQERIDNLNKERDAIIEKRFISHKEQDEFEKQIALEIKLRDHNKENIAIDQEILKLLQARLAALKEVNDEEVVATGIIQRKKKEIEDIQKQLEATNNMADLGPGGRLTKALEIAQAELGDLQRAFREFHLKEFKLEISTATAELNKFIKAGEKINAAQLKQRFEIGMENLAATIPEAPPDVSIVLTPFQEFLSDLGDAWEQMKHEAALTGVDILSDQLKSQEQLELDSMKNRLKALKTFYDEQQILAGDNEKARELLRLRELRETTKLQREIFEKEKQTRRSQALIDGAAGVVKAFATYPYPAAIIISGLIAAQTLSQIRIINKQRPGFKKGVIDLQGPGTSMSDSIPANLSKHESVMTAWETQHAGDVLREIRAKRLDNKVLKELKQGRSAVQQQFNDERIIKAIEKNRPPDVIEQSGIVYKATKKSDTYLSKIRAKSVRL